MIFEFSTKADLIELIEEGELINESQYKLEVECDILLRRGGKLYMLHYFRSYSDGVQVEGAEINEVSETEVRRVDYNNIPGTTIYPSITKT